jgi:hypothetical protein
LQRGGKVFDSDTKFFVFWDVFFALVGLNKGILLQNRSFYRALEEGY